MLSVTQMLEAKIARLGKMINKILCLFTNKSMIGSYCCTLISKAYINSSFFDKKYTNTFFKLFKQGGIADNCVNVLQAKYDIGFLEKGNGVCEQNLSFWNKIVKKQEKIANRVLKIDFDALFEEIEHNLLKCQNEVVKDNYALNLMTPFVHFLRATKPIKNHTGNDGDRAKEIENGFYKITQMVGDDLPLAENIYKQCVRLLKEYANRLDLLLLQNGIDMMKVQEECGIWIKEYRLNTDFIQYGISKEMAKKYIERLSK